MKRLGSLTLFVFAVALLHAVATVPFPLPDRWTTFAASASLMSADLLVLLGFVVMVANAGAPRRAAHGASIGLLVATLFRAANGYFVANYDRPFELSDTKNAWGLWHYLLHDSSTGEAIAKSVAAALAVFAVHVLLAWCFARVARAGASRGGITAAIVLQAVVLVGAFAAPWHPSSFAALVAELGRTVTASDARFQQSVAAGKQRMASVPHDLRGLAGADVHVVFVESYGRVAIDHPQVSPRVTALWSDLAPQLAVAGFEVRTVLCRPAIRGGASWIAHAQFFAGARIDHQRGWELLLRSDLTPLPKVFADAGYETVEVMPAMDRHWPAGQAFFGFTASLTQIELGYRGTRYHWGQMPDQFALHHLLRSVVEPATKPLFTTFMSVTSHTPFRRVPPYFADWKIDDRSFAVPPLREHDEVPWNGVGEPEIVVPAYLDTLEHTLRSVTGFVCRLTRPSIVIVLGDHQPPFANSLHPPDPSFDVPMHVFTNRPELVAQLAGLGLARGFAPAPGTEGFDTAIFAPEFLRLFSK
ncbi:MAG: sulfatase-like hydrolase/transferase [Planctomycetes bacterium]|nr:sulfatase-like hydrolase/transferase [Planctomycetota bacterium]